MNTQKIEATLNLLMLLAITFVAVKFTNVSAIASSTVTNVSRAALQSDADYEMDAYETCTIVDQKSDAECDKLLNEGNQT
jgi:hypothetical protein